MEPVVSSTAPPSSFSSLHLPVHSSFHPHIISWLLHSSQTHSTPLFHFPLVFFVLTCRVLMSLPPPAHLPPGSVSSAGQRRWQRAHHAERSSWIRPLWAAAAPVDQRCELQPVTAGGFRTHGGIPLSPAPTSTHTDTPLLYSEGADVTPSPREDVTSFSLLFFSSTCSVVCYCWPAPVSVELLPVWRHKTNLVFPRCQQKLRKNVWHLKGEFRFRMTYRCWCFLVFRINIIFPILIVEISGCASHYQEFNKDQTLKPNIHPHLQYCSITSTPQTPAVSRVFISKHVCRLLKEFLSIN